VSDAQQPFGQEFTRTDDPTPEVRTIRLGDLDVPVAPSFLHSLNCPAPERLAAGKQLPGPAKFASDANNSIIRQMVNQGAPCWLAVIIGQTIGALVFGFTSLVGMLLWAFEAVAPKLLPIGLDFINKFRTDMDPQVATIAVLVLNELLGTEFNSAMLPTGTDLAGHIARAGDIGKLFHQQMLQNFTLDAATTTDYGAGAAQRLTGQIVNFGVATALLGLAGEIGSIGLFKDFRLIGEQVTSGLGLGRMNRLAMRPLINTTVSQPYQWYLNRRFHPTQFKAAELANPFTQTLIDPKLLYASLDLEGWSDEKKQALVELHQKRLALDDVEILKRWGYWDETTTHKYLVKLGWPEELADTAGRIPELKRIDARITRLVDKLESEVQSGHMTADDALALMKTLPITEDERAVIQATMIAHTKVPHRSLTLTEVEKAFESGIYTADQLTGRLQQLGYNGDDLNTLYTLTLLKFGHDVEAKAVAKFTWDQKVSKAKAKGLPIPPQPAILSG